MIERTASCACGQLRVTCEGDPVRVSICNCTQCQKRTGSVYGVGAYFKSESVKGIEGEAKVFSRSSDAGRWLKLSFCPVCGTSVYWEAEFRPGIVGVAVGAFDDKNFPAPQVVVWADHRFCWASYPEGAPVFGKAPS